MVYSLELIPILDTTNCIHRFLRMQLARQRCLVSWKRTMCLQKLTNYNLMALSVIMCVGKRKCLVETVGVLPSMCMKPSEMVFKKYQPLVLRIY